MPINGIHVRQHLISLLYWRWGVQQTAQKEAKAKKKAKLKRQKQATFQRAFLCKDGIPWNWTWINRWPLMFCTEQFIKTISDLHQSIRLQGPSFVKQHRGSKLQKNRPLFSRKTEFFRDKLISPQLQPAQTWNVDKIVSKTTTTKTKTGLITLLTRNLTSKVCL